MQTRRDPTGTVARGYCYEPNGCSTGEANLVSQREFNRIIRIWLRPASSQIRPNQ